MMIRNPECCVSPQPMYANRSLERSRSEQGRQAMLLEPVGEAGAPAALGRNDPSSSGQTDSVTLSSHTLHTLQKPIPAARWGSASNSGWEFCILHSNIHSPHVHPNAAQNPSASPGTRASKKPTDGKEGSGRNCF